MPMQDPCYASEFYPNDLMPKNFQRHRNAKFQEGDTLYPTGKNSDTKPNH